MTGSNTILKDNDKGTNNEDAEVHNNLPAMFRPPINRTMRVLDRSFFRKTVPLSVAAIHKASDIASVRRDLLKSRDILSLPRLTAIREIRDAEGQVQRGVLLREGVKADGRLILHGGHWHWGFANAAW